MAERGREVHEQVLRGGVARGRRRLHKEGELDIGEEERGVRREQRREVEGEPAAADRPRVPHEERRRKAAVLLRLLCRQLRRRLALGVEVAAAAAVGAVAVGTVAVAVAVAVAARVRLLGERTRVHAAHAVESAEVVRLVDGHEGGGAARRRHAARVGAADVRDECGEDLLLSASVDGAQRVVEQQEGRLAVQGASEGDALLLAATERDAALSHLGTQPVGQSVEVSA